MKKLASLLLAGGLATAVWAAPQAGTSAGTPANGAGAQAGSKTAIQATLERIRKSRSFKQLRRQPLPEIPFCRASSAVASHCRNRGSVNKCY